MRPLIPAWLDELGLKPTEFRVLSNLWRRARWIEGNWVAYPGSKNIVKTCCISRDTVWPVLRSLEEKELVHRAKKKFGMTNRYVLRIPKEAHNGSRHSAAVPGQMLTETKGHHLAGSAGYQSAGFNGPQGDQWKAPNMKGANESATPATEWLPSDDQNFIARTLELNPTRLKKALQAFLDYKRHYPTDPRDAMAVLQFFQNTRAGKCYLQEITKGREVPEPPGWREVLGEKLPGSCYGRGGEHETTPWPSFTESERQTIWALFRQFTLIAP